MIKGIKNYEQIIIDGESIGGTIEYLKEVKEKYMDSQLMIYSNKDDGIYDSMNKGATVANGEYLIFKNGGDRFYNSEVLQKVSAAIDKEPNFNIYYGDYLVCYPNRRIRNQIRYKDAGNIGIWGKR